MFSTVTNAQFPTVIDSLAVEVAVGLRLVQGLASMLSTWVRTSGSTDQQLASPQMAPALFTQPPTTFTSQYQDLLCEAPEVVCLEGTFGVRHVSWHTPANIGSAAFWIDQTRRSHFPSSPRIGSTLAKEVAVCLLGGHGVTGEMTVAAFNELERLGMLDDPNVDSTGIELALRRPLSFGFGCKPRRYRFPVQRAFRLSCALRAVHTTDVEGLEPTELRRWLLELPGIGMKTASWIARNVAGGGDMAVIDIHVLRAGTVAGVFDPKWLPQTAYGHLEDAFCAWARAGEVVPWQLDSCIWNQLAAASRIGVRLDST